MKVRDSVVFVTGANRGLGLAYARAAPAAGASKVYAAARDPSAAPGQTAGVRYPGRYLGEPQAVAAA
ncbi:MAG: putative oxidoreductase, family [Polaromonas sp.]|nr:putative oxidoreductase, family [Polaromonas sp.]